MRILLLCPFFPPEVGSAAHIFFELGSELVKRGHRVTVLTGFPEYNVAQPDLTEVYRSKRWMKETMNGLEVVRIRVPQVPRRVPVLRGMHQLAFSAAQAFSGIFLARDRADVILAYSPPLFLGLAEWVLRPFKRARIILNVQDLFPQSAIDLGVLRNPVAIRALRGAEKFIYSRMDMVAVHSPGNQEHVLRCGGHAGRVVVVHNPVDTTEITPGPRLNAFRERHGIPERVFIVSFAGVIGLSQDLDTVIVAATILRSHPDILVYIVGGGLEKERLMKKAQGMDNVRFLPMLPKPEYVALLHASDVCLATLRKDVKTPVVPSKIHSIMAAGRPVVAAQRLDSDTPAILREARCGIAIEPEDPGALAAAILSYHQNPERVLEHGRNGREYVERHYSLDGCTSLYEELFRSITQNSK